MKNTQTRYNMTENTMTVEIEPNTPNGYQIIVANIKYGKELARKSRERPEIATLDVPEALMKIQNDTEKFMDGIESFAYNTLTRKYGAEVNYCQIWLPVEK